MNQDNGGDRVVRLARRTRPKYQRIVERACPGCDYRITQFEITQMRVNFKCSQCKKYSISEFVPSRMEPA